MPQVSLLQIVTTPSIEQDDQVKEKNEEETKQSEEKQINQESITLVPLQVSPSTSYIDSKGEKMNKKKKEAQAINFNLATLDEVIVIQNQDPNIFDEERLTIYTKLSEIKKEQARLRKEHKQKQVLHDVKNILLNVDLDIVLNENAPILDE